MKLKLSIILFLLIAGISSCRKELLSPIPQTSISDLVAFETAERTLAAVNGMYAGAKVGQIYGGRYLVYQDIRGEEFINETANGVTNLQTWNFTLTSGTNEVQNFWGAAYAGINRVNVVIAGLDASPISDVLKNQYRGEARFLRALLYHTLVTLYARPYADGNGAKPGVVIYTNAQTSSGDNKKARSTVAEVYSQILDDLTFAEANLPASYGTQYLNVTRAHKNTAIALKTRVYLYMGRYADVITEANKIVPAVAPFMAASGVQHKLEPSVANVFGTGGQTLENILSFPFTSLDLPGTQNSLNLYYSPGTVACPTCSGGGEYTLNLGATGIVADANWTAADARRTNFVQAFGGKTYLRKWNDNTNFVPGIRYAEVMLNLAEALARTNVLDARAIALLNAVRKRSDPAVTLTPLTQAESISMILRERRIELLGEGFRSRDLLRLMMTIPAKGTVAALAPTDAQYVWPIPLSELVVNTVIEQNTGY